MHLSQHGATADTDGTVVYNERESYWSTPARDYKRVLATGFFADCPWLAVPLDQKSDLRPLYTSCAGLLGGSSSDAPKKSKLAALAAARRKKENDKASQAPTSSVALLDKLNAGSVASKDSAPRASSSLRSIKTAKPVPSKPKETERPALPPESQGADVKDAPSSHLIQQIAAPSTFAQTISGAASSTPSLSSIQADSYSTRLTFAKDAFAGPSPDDVVANAQSASKGLKKGQKENAPKKEGETKGSNKKTKDITTGLAQASINDTPRTKSPKRDKIDVLAEYKKSQGKPLANFVVIGKLVSLRYLVFNQLTRLQVMLTPAKAR